jgi:pyruvate/2-oxoglutarate dehydrogenase complex dihydrolipoamide acyltransferase (E2) component
MATDVLMPRLSDSMEEGTVLKWIVQPGGEVKRGEPLVEIETDKANMTYEADTDGVLIEVLAQEGETLPIGQVIARIGVAGEEVSGLGSRVSEKASRPVWWRDGWTETSIYEQDDVRTGDVIAGPAIVESPADTFAIPPGRKATLDQHRIWHLEAS